MRFGSALMQKVIEFAGPQHPVQLQVATYNHRARAFCRKWGFIEQPGSESLHDGVITEVTMIRSGDWSSVNDEAGS